MITTISQWGSSLGVRIPKAIAEHLELFKGSKVDIREEEGHIVIQKYPSYTLEELLQDAESNPHQYESFDSTQGLEEW